MGRKSTRGLVCNEELKDVGLSSTRIEWALMRYETGLLIRDAKLDTECGGASTTLRVPGLTEEAMVIGGGTVCGYQSCATPQIRNIS